jgi:hypothetical protein
VPTAAGDRWFVDPRIPTIVRSVNRPPTRPTAKVDTAEHQAFVAAVGDARGAEERSAQLDGEELDPRLEQVVITIAVRFPGGLGEPVVVGEIEVPHDTGPGGMAPATTPGGHRPRQGTQAVTAARNDAVAFSTLLRGVRGVWSSHWGHSERRVHVGVVASARQFRSL